MALAILIATPGVHHACRVKSKAVPAASGDLSDLNAPQRSNAPGLLLIIPAFIAAVKLVCMTGGFVHPPRPICKTPHSCFKAIEYIQAGG